MGRKESAVKPRVPLFVIALLIGASTWMHRTTSADADPAPKGQAVVPAAPGGGDSGSPNQRPLEVSQASTSLLNWESQ